MTAPAIVMMVVTILIVWGGLVASIVALRFLPTPGGEPRNGRRNGSQNGTKDGDGNPQSDPAAAQQQ